VKIAELKEGMLTEVEGIIASVAVRSYETCSKCKRIACGGICAACGSKETTWKVVVNALLKDDSDEIWCVLSGKNGKDFLGVKEIPKDVKAETILELKSKEIIGKRVVVSGSGSGSGSARRNKDTGKLELFVSRII
jgi:Fe-S cluster biogenesis protein NfuA